MKTFKIEDGDIIFDKDMNITMVENEQEQIQSIERILTTFMGEWFLNKFHGLDYESIRGKAIDKESISLSFIEAITQDKRVKEITYIDININNKKRALEVDFKYTTIDDSEIEMKEVFDLE